MWRSCSHTTEDLALLRKAPTGLLKTALWRYLVWEENNKTNAPPDWVKSRDSNSKLKMLIACKCLNITLKTAANNLPSALPAISNYDDIAYTSPKHTVSPVNQRDQFEDNHEDQPPYLQCSTAENLDSNQLQFFRTVNIQINCILRTHWAIKWPFKWSGCAARSTVMEQMIQCVRLILAFGVNARWAMNNDATVSGVQYDFAQFKNISTDYLIESVCSGCLAMQIHSETNDARCFFLLLCR